MDEEPASNTADPLLEKTKLEQSINNGITSPLHELSSKKDVEETDLKQLATRTCNKICSKKFLIQRLPILSWIVNYNLEMLLCDTIAGVTTALTVIPQGIGYAPLAGLPLQYGLYGSIVPGFVYCILGTTRESTVGPTAVNFLMSYNYAGGTPYKAVTLAFWAGLIEILAGIFNLGFLIQFVSGPVMSAFTSVVSILVITSCVKGFFGIYFKGRGFITIWRGLFENILSVRLYDMAVGLCCMALLYFLRKLKEVNWCEGEDKAAQRAKVIKKTKWLLSISANCVVVVSMSIIAWILVDVANIDVLTLTGEVDSGLPAWQLPWLFNRNFTSENMSDVEDVGAEEAFNLAGEFGLGLAMIPLVSILQHLAIAKHYAGNKKMAASQEMIALGFCQFIGSFTGSAAITASFGRSAVNAASGVRTPFGGVITGIIIILTCAFLSPYLAYIPTSALSAVIIFAMFFTIEYSVPVKLFKGRKIDLLPYTLTFIIGLLVSVEMGLITGTLVHMVILISSTSSPSINVVKNSTHIILQFESSLFFPAKDHLIREINNIVASCGDQKIIIMDMSLVKSMDYTVASGLSGVIKDCKKKSLIVALCCVNGSVIQVLNSVHDKDLQTYSSVDVAVQETNC